MNTDAEWLEVDGLGGFASGTVSGRRTRRYHALLLTATTPPTGRVVLVNGFEAWAQTASGRYALSSQHYVDVNYPDGDRRLESFTHEPWPHWVYRLEDGTRIEEEIFVPHGRSAVVVRWRLLDPSGSASLMVRPLFSGRDHHALHHANPAFNFEPEAVAGSLVWQPYPTLPGIALRSSGDYRHEPEWYRNVVYTEEQNRGLDFTEDLASPGVLTFPLSDQWSVAIFEVPTTQAISPPPTIEAETLAAAEAKRRAAFASPLERAADAYLVQRGAGKTIIAGYPWFTDWGRDTFIALRGLCLATGRFDDAQQILLDWAGTVSEGMLPNRFLDQGDMPEFNSVDASLWFIIAAHDFLQARETAGNAASTQVRKALEQTIEAILTGYARGTRYGIRLDSDGLLACGKPGVQLTWMDAKVGDWVVTPRIGKPVEVQCLWLNALTIASRFSDSWTSSLALGRESFAAKFWNAERDCLFDVIDADHIPDKNDAAIRPNQIFAVGGLPIALLEGEPARRVVEVVEQQLLTPLGLRSLAPHEPSYAPHYVGDLRERDGAYHQGTVWPWLLGPFIEAWIRVRGNSNAAKQEANQRFIPPLLAHLNEAGLGHISEITDAERPYTPRGCPFQAWSLGELLRIQRTLLAEVTSPIDTTSIPS
jgi:predicted glycogen debranching enzyme